MFKEEDIKKLPDKFADIVNKLEKEVIDDIVRRLAESKEITRVIDWELYRINQLRTYDHDLRKLIQEALSLEDETMKALYDDIIEKGYAADAELYSKAGIPFIPYEENTELQQFVQAIKVQTQGSMENVTKTSGFVTSGGEFVRCNQYFRKMLDMAVIQAHSGAFNYEDTLRRTVNELTNSGLRTVEYESGRRDRIEVAVRRAVMTGLHQITTHISEKNAEALGTEYFEVSAHSTARPSHAQWQGKVYSLSELHSICGLGDILGLCGINCYHHYDPFVKGVSKRKYSDEDLENIKRRNQEKKAYKGREYTLYEATQRQRELERRMRIQDRKIELLKLGDSNQQEVTILKMRRLATHEEYQGLCKSFGLQEQMNRVFIKNNKKSPPFEDITHKYDNVNRIGEVTKDDGYLQDENHLRDEATAHWLAKLTGKDIHLLKESTEEGVHTPDARTSEGLWEFKNVSSKSSVHHRIQEAFNQIKDNPRGLVLNIRASERTGIKMSDEIAIKWIKDKLKFYQKYTSLEVIIKDGDRLVRIIRMNKKSIKNQR